MDDAEAAVLFAKFYSEMRQQLEVSHKLIIGLASLRAAVAEKFPEIDAAYAAKYVELQAGPLGQTIAQDIAAFDDLIEAMKEGPI